MGVANVKAGMLSTKPNSRSNMSSRETPVKMSVLDGMQYTVKLFLFVGRLILCFVWVGQCTNLRFQ